VFLGGGGEVKKRFKYVGALVLKLRQNDGVHWNQWIYFHQKEDE
jgi:hypothetical protein